MDVSWLASYPRSGNTWMRFLLATYVFGRVERSLDVERRIPNIHRRVSFKPDGRYICKTHYPFSARHPHRAETRRFVYLVRSPKDVLLSNLSYLRMTGRGPADATSFVRQFIRQQGVELWKSAGLGTWTGHVRSWLWNEEIPGLVLRYEEMRKYPAAALSRVVRFLGLPWDSERIDWSVDSNSLDRMRALERREKESGRDSLFAGDASGFRRGLRFVRSGLCQQSLKAIDPELDARFETRLEPFWSEVQARIATWNEGRES